MVKHDQHLWPVLDRARRNDLDPIVALLQEDGWLPNPRWRLAQLREGLHDQILWNGGNTFANFVRGEGVPWAEIVREVATKLNVKLLVSDSTLDVERKVVLTVLERAVEEMTPEQRAELRDNLERAGMPRDLPIGQGTLVAALLVGKIAGFAAHKALVIVANAVARAVLGHGLRVATNAALTRGLGLALGPIGWAVTGVWTLIGIAGPAFRITIPAVVMVGVLRASQGK